MTKLFRNLPGIYYFAFKNTDHIYVGQGQKISKRLIAQKADLRANRHPNDKFQKTFNKYGLENLVYGVIEYCEKENLIKQEQYWMDTLKPDLNIVLTAGCIRGHKLSLETRAKMSVARKAYKMTPEWIANIASSLTGKKASAEARAKMSASNHKVFTEEERLKASIRCKELFTGIPLKEEHKKKISLAKTGKTFEYKPRPGMVAYHEKRRQEKLKLDPGN